MKLRCGCEILIASDPSKPVLLEEGETHRMAFCEAHQAELRRIIETNGGFVQEDPESGQIQAGELTVRALNAIEEFMIGIVQTGMAEAGLLPPEMN